MSSIGQRHADWCRKNYKIKGSEDFRADDGFAWVVDKFFEPAFGWRLMARNPGQLCDSCRDQVGTFVDWDPQTIAKLKMHRRRKKDCEGLFLAPTSVMVQNLARGDGKTSNTFALVAAALADPNLAPLRIQFMASAGSQTDTLVKENLLDPVAASKVMRKRFVHKGNKVIVDHGRRGQSYLEFVESSHKSVTGRRRGILLIDEARDVDARTVAALVPSVRSTSKLACPRGHAEREYRDEETHKCPTCGEWMLPQVPRVWLTSTSGIDVGEELWFNELVELYQRTPDPLLYLHRSEKSLNPKVATVENDMLELFAQVPALRPYMAVEMSNVPAGKGDRFVTRSDLDSCVDQRVAIQHASLLPCVGFLDTSWSNELTTLFLNGWDPDECDDPWQLLWPLHWQIWEPAKQARGVIDPDAVWDYCDETLERFPGLEVLLVDDRGSGWAKDFVVRANRERGRTWGRLVKAFHGKRVRDAKGRTKKLGARIPGLFGGEDDRILGWQLLEQRIAATVEGRPRLALPPREVLPELHEELLGVVRKLTSDGGYQITDRNRKRRHADVAECLAGTCLLAHLRAQRHQPRLDDQTRSGRDDALAQFLKPVTGGITPKGFF